MGQKLPKAVFSPEEIAEHNTAESCWISANGLVFDVTGFLDRHPAGAKSILLRGGKDATRDFNFHSASAKNTYWMRYCIGRVGKSCGGGGGGSYLGSYHPPKRTENTASTLVPTSSSTTSHHGADTTGVSTKDIIQKKLAEEAQAEEQSHSQRTKSKRGPPKPLKSLKLPAEIVPSGTPADPSLGCISVFGVLSSLLLTEGRSPDVHPRSRLKRSVSLPDATAFQHHPMAPTMASPTPRSPTLRSPLSKDVELKFDDHDPHYPHPHRTESQRIFGSHPDLTELEGCYSGLSPLHTLDGDDCLSTPILCRSCQLGRPCERRMEWAQKMQSEVAPTWSIISHS